MRPANNAYFGRLKGALVFSFFLLRGLSIDELLGRSAGLGEFSIGTYLLAGGLILFSMLALLQNDARFPAQFFYLFGVVFLITLSFLFQNNLNAGAASFGLYMEYVSSLSLVLFIFFTFRSKREIDILFKALIYSSLIISGFGIIRATQEPDMWRIGNIAGSGASYPTVSYQLAAAAWVGPMTNLIARNRKLSFKVFRDIPLLSVFTYGIMLTGTRGGLLAELLLVGALLIFHFKETAAKNVARFYIEISIAIILPVAALGYFISQSAEQLAVARSLDILNPDAISGRTQLWTLALDQGFGNLQSLLVGGGFGSFQLFLTEAEGGKYPHNFFLDLASNGGFPAAILMTFWIVSAWKHVFQHMRQKEQDTLSKKLMLKLLGWGIVACYSGLTVFKFSSNIMLWFFLALAMRMRQNWLMEFKAPTPKRETC